MASKRLPIAAVNVRAIAHATENVESVRRCVRELVGDDPSLQETRSRGYHHQPLRVIEAEVRNARPIRDLLDRMRTEELKADYERTWELRLDPDEGTVHFRLAKQPLMDGRVELEAKDGEGDLVKLVFKLLAYPARPESFRKVARDLFKL